MEKLSLTEQNKQIESGITPEVLEEWRHSGLAAVGNFTKEAQYAAYNLSKLVREYEKVLSENRSNLEMNRRGVEIQLPYLPQGDRFNESAAKEDTNFFKEFCRRVCCGVPLESSAEPLYSALISLKKCYEKEIGKVYGNFYETKIPSLAPVLNLPLGKRPPLTFTQIADYVLVFGGGKISDRALSRHAKTFGIPIASRGRRKSGT